MKRIFPILVLIGLLTSSCGVLSPTGRNLDKDYRFNASRDRITLQHEVRGVWLTTVGGYDWPDKNDNANTQKQKLRSLIRKIREAGCNVVFFQVVSNMDAMYPSAILPWSHVITGTQGQDPGYDPLTEAINAKNEAVQNALKAENKVKEAEAEAKIAIAKAKGEAEAQKITGDGEAYYNRVVAASLNALLVQQYAIEKWNGELPTYNGSNALPFINLSK